MLIITIWHGVLIIMAIKTKIFNHNEMFVSKKQFDEHTLLYNRSINKFNELSNLLNKNIDVNEPNSIYTEYSSIKKALFFALNNIILHEQYFTIISPNKSYIQPKTKNIINKYFDDLETWQTDFFNCAMSCTGWTMLIYEQRTNSYKNIFINSTYSGSLTFSFPIIILDCYEHSYFNDFGTNKADYVKLFLKNISM